MPFKSVNRKNTDSYKWDKDNLSQVIPFSIADSDYKSPKPIVDALKKRAKQGVFGYTFVSDELRNIIPNWILRRYHYSIDSKAIVFTPGVITGLALTLNAITKPLDSVIIQTPVYNRFFNAVADTNRTLIKNPLVKDESGFRMDLKSLETSFKNGAKAMILCNPHNPVGRVWSYDELNDLVKLAQKYQIYILSDEIHADIIMPPYTFNSMGQFFKVYDRILVYNAPSKTFNVPGLQLASMVIPNVEIRSKIESGIASLHLDTPNLFALTATKIAYTKCDQWVDAQNEHIESNYQYVKNALRKYPSIELASLEGTYLLWLNIHSLNKTSDVVTKELHDLGIGVVDGAKYDPDNHEYIRFNIACSFKQLKKGLSILIQYLELQK